MTRTHALILSTLCLGALTACGGNGGSSPSPAPFDANPNYAAVTVTTGPKAALTASNYKDATYAGFVGAYVAASWVSNGVDFLSSALDNPSSKGSALQPLRSLPRLPAFGHLDHTLQGVSEDYTLPCEGGGGSMHFNDHDGGEADVPDSGDSRTIRFDNCRSDQDTISGEVRITYLKTITSSMDDGPFPFNGEFNVGFKGLKVTIGATGHVVELNGLGHVVRSKASANSSSDTVEVASLEVKMTRGASTETLAVTQHKSLAASNATVHSYDILASVVSSSRLGGASVAVGSATPFSELVAADYPESGTLAVYGATGMTNLKATQTGAELLLDGNDDDLADFAAESVPWTSVF